MSSHHLPQMASDQAQPLDIDELVISASLSPSAFARRRENLIQDLIEQSRPTANLRSLQMYIDLARYSSPSADMTHLRLAEMTRESAAILLAAVNRLDDLIDALLLQPGGRTPSSQDE